MIIMPSDWGLITAIRDAINDFERCDDANHLIIYQVFMAL